MHCIFNTLSVSQYIAPYLWSHHKIFIDMQEKRALKQTEENFNAIHTNKYLSNIITVNCHNFSFLIMNQNNLTS